MAMNIYSKVQGSGMTGSLLILIGVLLINANLAIGQVVPVRCPTTGGSNCVFPFKWKSSTSTTCGPNGESYNWCATSLTADGEYDDWDYCEPSQCLAGPGWVQIGTDNCWTKCGSKGGPCEDFCGSGGFCCRQGYGDCPSEAGDVSPTLHTCVKISDWVQIGADNCWTNCGSKGGPCEDFCGSGGFCCRQGYGDCPSEAGGVSPFLHTCVKKSGWFQTSKDNCWTNCGSKGGPCEDYCGSGGFCCRQGYGDCPSEAGDVSPIHHTCVKKSGWFQMSKDNCWTKCGSKGGPCEDFCGSGGFCCRQGYGDCPSEAKDESPIFHTCVKKSGSVNGASYYHRRG